jgi:hypothetical protein
MLEYLAHICARIRVYAHDSFFFYSVPLTELCPILCLSVSGFSLACTVCPVFVVCMYAIISCYLSLPETFNPKFFREVLSRE